MTPPMMVDPKDEDMKELFDQAMAAYEVVMNKQSKNKGDRDSKPLSTYVRMTRILPMMSILKKSMMTN